MVSWGTIQSAAIFFGPWLIPKLLAWYRSIRNRPASQIKPLPRKTSYALTVLFISGLVALISTLPLFQPENIFRLTKSQLRTTAGVLLTRLAAIRNLTPQDEKLRDIFNEGGLPARLLYARYGPSILLNSPLSPPGSLDAQKDYLLYALPSLLLPHTLHLLTLGLITSPLLAGSIPSRWRPLATISALALAAAEVYYITTYSDTPNLRSSRLNDISFPHFQAPLLRGLAIATTDAALGLLIYLHATNRAFAAPPTPAERTLDTALSLEKLLVKARGVGVIRNAVVRDPGARGRVEDYWRKEGEVMKDVFEEPEVLEAQRNALRRLDTARVGRDAEGFVETILGPASVANVVGTGGGQSQSPVVVAS
ncbi:hypothetical protein M409DRAFT_59019 [Zasmidium cellare ATCC 36951]|uniref:Uncharacterized protein n=1 Tax=Zasmidium cellare ATCC 36951 TaxID=1080233 RepID=A0A6A6C3N8_ZASCE|nr:uncharacterized protein M409DRAFT_59019 [Zasmidium cellare ATCC 36951]KAF2161635.1 hypothetical protein M409DRAFT_59019 [Zasmidium cellare ATCC 36951]